MRKHYNSSTFPLGYFSKQTTELSVQAPAHTIALASFAATPAKVRCGTGRFSLTHTDS